jgi:hypothetical protein
MRIKKSYINYTKFIINHPYLLLIINILFYNINHVWNKIDKRHGTQLMMAITNYKKMIKLKNFNYV